MTGAAWEDARAAFPKPEKTHADFCFLQPSLRKPPPVALVVAVTPRCPLSRACPFSLGKLGVAAPGCVSEAVEMECGRSEIDELIKEVSGAACPGRRGESGASGWHACQDGTGGPGLAHLPAPAPRIPSLVPRAGAQLLLHPPSSPQP